MALWKNPFTLTEIEQFSQHTLQQHLGIQLTAIGEDYVSAKMPVDQRTHQPMGILHGGASVALAETLGSIAAQMAAEKGSSVVGLDINANHLRRVTHGWVYATARPVHIGKSTQVWQILIEDEQQQNCCIARLTTAVLKPLH